jgi:hypothetical protein
MVKVNIGFICNTGVVRQAFTAIRWVGLNKEIIIIKEIVRWKTPERRTEAMHGLVVRQIAMFAVNLV